MKNRGYSDKGNTLEISWGAVKYHGKGPKTQGFRRKV
jgi:hypothetical protein